MSDELAERPPVVVVSGPTAAGKTDVGIQIALRFGGEIINADSMQVYRYLDIGTAKPTIEQRARVPHHLFDIVNPDVAYNAGRYSREARAAALGIGASGALPVLVGGTGLYIRAFLEGIAPARADSALRARLEREHAESVAAGAPDRLHQRLAEIDPRAASRIHPRDVRRIVRALEIASLENRPASEVQSRHAFMDRPYRSLYLALDPGRRELDERIDRRCLAMIEGGLLQEVRRLRDRGFGPELRSMQAIGYRHIQPVVDGSDSLANALVSMQRDTKQFAKRQRTWLRRVPEVCWAHPHDLDGTLRRVEAFLEAREPEKTERGTPTGVPLS